MDFQSVLSIAAKKTAEKQVHKKFSTNLAPPKKEKKEKEKTVKSETLRKLIAEKEAEKKRKELALQRKREEEEKRRKEEEKKKIFRIPKNKPPQTDSSKSADAKKQSGTKSDKVKVNKYQNDKVKVDKNHNDKVKVDKNHNDKVKVDKNKDVKMKVDKGKSDKVKVDRISNDKHSKEKSSKSILRFEKIKHPTKKKKENGFTDSGRRTESKEKKEEKIDPTKVKPTALSTHDRSSHLYEIMNKVQNRGKESEVERRRREFEEKKARLLLDIKAKGVTSGFDKMRKGKVSSGGSEKTTEETKEDGHKSRKRKSSVQEDLKSDDSRTSNKSKHSSQKSTPSEMSKNIISDRLSEKDSSANSTKVKPKKPNVGSKAPPPMGFSDLLKLAEVKSKEPVQTENVKKAQPLPEPERPMTQEEKERFYEEQRRKQRLKQERQENSTQKLSQENINSHKPSKTSHSSVDKGDNKIQGSKLKNALLNGISKNDKVIESSSKSSSVSKSSSSSSNSHHTNSGKVLSKSQSASSLSKNSNSDLKSKSRDRHSMGPPEAKRLKLDRKPHVNKSVDRGSPQTSLKQSSKMQEKPTAKKRDIEKTTRYDCENENILTCGPSKPKPVVPAVSQNPWDRITSQMKRNNPPPVKKRRILDDEDEDSEYDEEMEGFITDEGSDVEEDYPDEFDYSKHVRQIFGYDKRKYRYESDREIAGMESNFREQMKEEARSARLGLQEDLEDIRREEEELRRKNLKSKVRR